MLNEPSIDSYPAETYFMINEDPELIDLVWFGFCGLIYKGNIIASKESDSEKSTSWFIRIKRTKNLNTYELSLLDKYFSEEYISIKEYSFFLSNFITDPTMFMGKYRYLRFLEESLIEKGILEKKKSLFRVKVKLSDKGQKLSQSHRSSILGKEYGDFDSFVRKELLVEKGLEETYDDLKNQTLNFMNEYKLSKGTPLGRLNKAHFPRKI